MSDVLTRLKLARQEYPYQSYQPHELLGEAIDELTAARDEAERLRARVAELESGRPPKLEWRKRVSKWSAFLEGLKGAPIPKGQRNTAASIKKEIDRYIEYGIGHDETNQ